MIMLGFGWENYVLKLNRYYLDVFASYDTGGTLLLVQSRLLNRNVSAFLIRGLPFQLTVRGSHTRLT